MALKRILVVDDNAAFGEMVEMIFQGEYEVLKALDGAAGLGLARESRPDLILLDVMMPNVSGMEMLRQLQAEPETRRIPVLILTASQFDASTHQVFAQEGNVRAFLRKPCGVSVLREQIEAALKPKRQT